MNIEFDYPWLLTLFPALLALSIWIYRRNISRVGARSLKNRAALALRAIMLLLLTLSLAAPSYMTDTGRAASWILLDASDSMKSAREQMERAAAEGILARPEDMEVGVIAFGKDAMVEQPLSKQPGFASLQTAVDARYTDAASALSFAGAMLPSDAIGRVALLSDGRFQGAQDQAALLGARGIPIDVMYFEPDAPPDAQVSAIGVPSTVYQNQQFQVSVSMYSNMETQGTLVLSANREPVATREVSLRRGENTYVFTDVAKSSGVVTYEAQLIAEGDERTQNDRAGAYIAVVGAPNVLIVEGRAGEGRELQKMLNASGMETTMISPEGTPTSAEALRQFDAIALANAAADSFSDDSVSALDAYVRYLGRGLAVFGGDNSYALGEYRGSALEAMLPVTINVRNTAELPSLALVLVIDKSGSMDATMFGTARMELAKEAAMKSVEVLTERDQVGVIGFDSASKWVVELDFATDIPEIQRKIGTIRSGGGTAFFSPLYDAMTALSGVEAQRKHVIFLTDGEPGDSGYETIASQMLQNGITLTTVAVGSGANAQLLKRLADSGGGRAYIAGEFDNIPRIFAKETYLVTGSYVQNRTFYPVVTEDVPMTGFDGFPPLDGYLASTEKPIASVSMVTDRNDPLLAWWQYGAGRVLAWTSDAQGAWTNQFLNWDEASAFFSGLVSHVLARGEQDGVLTSNATGDRLSLRYAAPQDADQQGVKTNAVILSPSGVAREIPMYETAPGVYEVEVDAPELGAHAVRIEQTQAGEVVRSLEGGAVMRYSPEYDLRAQGGADALYALAEATGGRVLTPDEGAQLLIKSPERVRARVSIAMDLVAWLLALFVLSVAMDRLPWDRAILAVLQRIRPKKEVRKTAMSKDAADKPTSARPRKDKPDESASSTTATDTADQLLRTRREKKKL